jgi:hypothetical protein
MLSGARNMTLGSLSDICFELGIKSDLLLRSKQDEDVKAKSDAKKTV